jgi:hypothetical protein
MPRAYFITPFQEFRDRSGINRLSGGTVTVYENLSTKEATVYSDPDLSVEQDNPYTLDSLGRIQNDLRFEGKKTLLIKDSTGVEVRTLDNVICYQERLPFSDWDSTATYGDGADNIVTRSGSYYVSIQGSNTGQDPATEAAYWKQIHFLRCDSDESDDMDTLAGLTPSQDSLILGTGSTWELSSLGAIRHQYITGLTLSNGADSDHDIDVSVGQASDSTNSRLMALSSALTKQIDATWASGDDAGGLASGATLAVDTWYHVFLVLVGGSVDVMFDTSVSCANGVANNSVTHYRRIGSILTDGSSNVVQFVQKGDYFYWDVFVNDASSNNPGTDAVTITTTVPTGVRVSGLYYLSMLYAGTSSNPVMAFVGKGAAEPSPTTGEKRIILGANPVGESMYQNACAKAKTNTSAQVQYHLSVSNTDVTAYISTQGWIDRRAA